MKNENSEYFTPPLLGTGESEWDSHDQAEINAQQNQADDEAWAEIEAEAERMRIRQQAEKEPNKAKIIADKYSITVPEVYQEIQNGNIEITAEYMKLVKGPNTK